MSASAPRRRIVILGGGYVGLYTALRLQAKLRRDEATTTVIDPRSYMTYQPFLPEASAGSLSPRHVVVPLRRVLRRCEILNASVTALDPVRQCVLLSPMEGPEVELPYDEVVVALGSIARTLPIPGLAETGVGFKTVEEAIYLRNQILHCLDAAESTDDADRRRRALTFCFVGGGYAGVGRSPNWRTWLGTPCCTTAGFAPATCGSCWWRRPTGSCPRSARTWVATRSPSSAGGTSTCGWTPGWSSRRTRSSGQQESRRTR
jgi:NADH dehydrogenase FAD-containing subunit